MNIGILTFHFVDNYGAVLQTLSLQYTLKTLFKDENTNVEVIDYRPAYHIKQRKPFKGFKMLYNSCKGTTYRKIMFAIMGLKTNIFYPRRVAKYKSINRFNSQYLNLTERFTTLKQLEKIEKKYDSVFVGSDQVWNKNITDKKFDEVYFATPFDNSCIAFSYAASSGDLIEKSDEEYFSKLLERFTLISARESELANQISEFTHRNCMTCCDPVFLLSKGQWLKLLKINEDTEPKEKYVLVYYVNKDKRISEFANEYAKKNNLNIVEIYYRNCCGGKLVYDATPKRFVNLINNAKYVVTNSFHGVAFSILMKKQFYVFTSASRNTRINNLLESLDITDDELLNGTVNYCSVDNKIEIMKNNSLDYLRNCISKISKAKS